MMQQKPQGKLLADYVRTSPGVVWACSTGSRRRPCSLMAANRQCSSPQSWRRHRRRRRRPSGRRPRQHPSGPRRRRPSNRPPPLRQSGRRRRGRLPAAPPLQSLPPHLPSECVVCANACRVPIRLSSGEASCSHDVLWASRTDACPRSLFLCQLQAVAAWQGGCRLPAAAPAALAVSAARLPSSSPRFPASCSRLLAPSSRRHPIRAAPTLLFPTTGGPVLAPAAAL